MQNLMRAYEQLYHNTNVSKGYKRNGDTLFLTDLSHFVGRIGTKYNDSDVKLLVVGRAINGWTQLPTISAESFAANAVQQFKTEPLEWVYNESTHCLGNGNGYLLNKSPFWRTSMNVWKIISGNPNFIDTQNNKWTDYIAWTNLFKIAPYDAGNPTIAMCKNQLESCKKILVAEINILKPTHILFITGYDGWFKDFEKIFPSEFTTPQKNICRGIGKNNIYAETTTISPNGTKIVVACRPEYRDEIAYIKDVCEKFK